MQAIFKGSVHTAQGTHAVSIIKTNQFMMYKEIITVCSEIHIKIQMNDLDTV